jgi:hypothetical protein
MNNIASFRQNASGFCWRCHYKLSRTGARCFNCDYKERESDGPWPEYATDNSLIYTAETIWNAARPLGATGDIVCDYMARRKIDPLALACDQLKQTTGLHKAIKVGAGAYLLARIWHVRKGFVGLHATRIESFGLERDIRRTIGACRGGAVWFGAPTPDTELVVGEGIETTLSAMVLWGATAGAATFGTAGLEALVLPQAARKVVIAADNDPPAPGKHIGEGQRAAGAARRAWLAEDPLVSVRIEVPDKAGKDWNDVLMEHCDA